MLPVSIAPRWLPVVVVATVCGFAPMPAVAAAETIAIYPAKFTLHGREARQPLLAERLVDGRAAGQLRDGVTWSSSDEKVVKIVAGAAIPVGDGTAKISAAHGGGSAEATVTVAAFTQPFAWSFRNHVEPVLSKMGCNSGACHGALAGKNGFKLSLRGYDPDGDFSTLTRQARGRRIAPSDPGRSLLLTKPTGAVPHKGGIRFDVGSLEYRVLAEWIAAGAAGPRPDDPHVTRLEILPGEATLRPGDKQQLLVLAHDSAGRVTDVTRWAKFTATEQATCDVDEAGQATVMGHGEGAITAWFSNQVVFARVTVPYDKPVADEVFARAPRRNFVDEHILTKLRQLRIPPSPPASDAEFLRRAFLDTIGVLPTVAETKAFLADTSPDKRDKLIDALLARPEFVDYWTYKWSDLLLVNSGEGKLPVTAMWAYATWIRQRVAANTPWDEFVRQLLTAQGGTLENGATNFFVLHPEVTDLTETASVAFLGMSITCARCHNHPLEKWTNDQYFAFANLFSRVKVKDLGGDGSKMVFSAAAGELVQPLTGKPQRPAPLDGETLAFDAAVDRRAKLAEWVVSPHNPYFSRAIVNRVWANFFGVGLVERVDDLRLTNPASNEVLLAAAADHLVAHKYDLKALMRTILQSHAYQRSSQPLAENKSDRRFYSRYYPRRLMAEVLLDALSSATLSPTNFPGYPAGWRAMQLPDSNVDSYFLRRFGRPDRVVTCECERTAEPSMVQVLHIANGDTLNKKLEAAGNRIDQLLAAKTADAAIIDDLYLAALCRLPTEKERAALVAALAEPGPHRRQAVEDVFWCVLSGKEFLFNH